MAVDATGAATTPDAIPTYNTAADAPSGKGLNNIVAALQTALNKRISIAAASDSDVPVWDTASSTWKRSGTDAKKIPVSALSPGSNGQVLVTSGGASAWGAAGAVMASTVAGLGTAVDGKLGVLRLGSSPFDFIALVYDATYGKWMSAPIVNSRITAANAVSAATAYGTPSTASTEAMLPVFAAKTAGLSLEVRCTSITQQSAAGTASVGGMPLTVDTVAGFFNDSVNLSAVVSTTNTAVTVLDSGWVPVNATWWAAITGNNKLVGFEYAFKSSIGTTTVTINRGGFVATRWVA